jgi:MFS family permease
METEYSVYRYRWVVLAIYMYVSALTQLYWLNFAAITTYIEDRFKIPAGDVMWFTLVFPLVQVLLTLPAGILIDKKGFKFGIGVGAVFTGVFSLFRLVDPGSFSILLISQIGISIGQPFVLNGITKLAVTWFSPKEEATAVGLGSLALFIGMMIALGATPWLVQNLSFESMLLIYGIMGIAGALAFLIFVKSRPPTPTRAAEIYTEVSNWGGIRNILKMRNFVILGFIAMVGIGVFNGLATWLEKILHDLHGISMTDAGSISALLILSGMVGCIIVPIISDKIRRRKLFIILTSAVGMICVSVLMFANGYDLNLANGILMGFFLISALPIMLTMSAEITGPRYAGVSVGYLQLLGNAAAVIIVSVMESLSAATGNFIAPLALLAVLLLGSLVMSILIRDTHPGA